VDKARFPKEEIEMVDAEELLFQGLKGIDGEIGGYNGQVGAFPDFSLKKLPDQTPFVIVVDATCDGCHFVLQT
jgi:hypothetical protein